LDRTGAQSHSGERPVRHTFGFMNDFATFTLCSFPPTFRQDLDPDHFLCDRIMANYPGRDIHRVYFAEILKIRGSEEFRKK
jgi:hypothetical protein